MTFQGKEITLENLSPVFTPEQEAAKRRELEQQLYEVFRKYADKRESAKYAGTDIKLDNEEYTVLHLSDILAIVE